MDIKIDPEVLREIVAAAIMAQIGTDGRDRLIEAAIKSLLTPVKSSYGDESSSPLDDAFRIAVDQAARQMCREYVERPEVQAQLQVKLAQALPVLLESLYAGEELATALALSIRRGSR